MRLGALVLAVLALACPPSVLPLRQELQGPAMRQDALELSDTLEKLIDAKEDTHEDREEAYQVVREWPQTTAAYAYGRAALVGRLAQIKGMKAGPLIPEMEKWARTSLALNPKFRNGAAKRMLGTLYVLAPASLLKHGDSEKGLAMLEEMVKAHPEDLENHLRVAEAYVSLDDPEPAHPYLCRALKRKKELRPDNQRLLDKLIGSVGKAQLKCSAG